MDAWNRNDRDAVQYLDAEVEWAPASPATVDQTVYRGHAEVIEGLQAIRETWEEFRFEEQEVRDLGDSVLWLGHVHARAAGSGVELDQEFAVRFIFRGEKVSGVYAFLSWREGFEAAGLRE